MGLLTIIFVLGAILRVGLGYLRPSAKTRFRNPERRQLATRIERIGDIVVFVTFAFMFLFGWRHDPSALVQLVWFVCLVGGFGAYALAHYVASRVTMSGLTLPGLSPSARPAPAPRREPSVRRIPAEPRPDSNPTPPASRGTKPGGAAGERRRPPGQPGGPQAPGAATGRRPAGATSETRPPARPPSRPARVREDETRAPAGRPPRGSGATQTRSPARPSTAPPRPAASPDAAPSVASGRDNGPPRSPESRRPASRRPPGLRRPNPIPPQPDVARDARRRAGDQADHKASPDDPTDLGGLP